MNKQELEELYLKKLQSLEEERDKLGRMYVEREKVQKPLTDHEILCQNECCSGISLEVTKLKAMLEEFGE